MQKAMELAGLQVLEGFHATKASCLLKSCIFNLINGYHRVRALSACWKKGIEGLSSRVRYESEKCSFEYQSQ